MRISFTFFVRSNTLLTSDRKFCVCVRVPFRLSSQHQHYVVACVCSCGGHRSQSCQSHTPSRSQTTTTQDEHNCHIAITIITYSCGEIVLDATQYFRSYHIPVMCVYLWYLCIAHTYVCVALRLRFMLVRVYMHDGRHSLSVSRSAALSFTFVHFYIVLWMMINVVFKDMRVFWSPAMNETDVIGTNGRKSHLHHHRVPLSCESVCVCMHTAFSFQPKWSPTSVNSHTHTLTRWRHWKNGKVIITHNTTKSCYELHVAFVLSQNNRSSVHICHLPFHSVLRCSLFPVTVGCLSYVCAKTHLSN